MLLLIIQGIKSLLFGTEYQTFIRLGHNYGSVSHTEATHTEIRYMFPNCSFIEQSTREHSQLFISPTQQESARIYCTVIAEYIESFGFETTIEFDKTTHPYVRAVSTSKQQARVELIR